MHSLFTLLKRPKSYIIRNILSYFIVLNFCCSGILAVTILTDIRGTALWEWIRHPHPNGYISVFSEKEMPENQASSMPWPGRISPSFRLSGVQQLIPYIRPWNFCRLALSWSLTLPGLTMKENLVHFASAKAIRYWIKPTLRFWLSTVRPVKVKKSLLWSTAFTKKEFHILSYIIKLTCFPAKKSGILPCPSGRAKFWSAPQMAWTFRN